jgi:uncharacterized membrane protein
MRGIPGFVKTTVIGGLFFLIPLAVFVFILAKAYNVMKAVAHPLSRYLDVDSIAGIAFANLLAILLVILLCFLAGLVARSGFMRRLAARFERNVLQGIPIYQLVKTTAESVLPLHREEGMQPVLVQFDDCSQLGLEVERQSPGQVAVYLPGSPNPWSGSLLLTTPERVTRLPVTMMEAMRTFQALGKGANALLNATAAKPAAAERA